MTAIAEMVDRYADQMLRRREAEDAMDDAIDAQVDAIVRDAIASADTLDEALKRHLVYIDDQIVAIGDRRLDMTRATLELMDMIRDGAPIWQLQAHEAAMRKTLADALRNDPGVIGRAEEMIECELAEVARERRA